MASRGGWFWRSLALISLFLLTVGGLVGWGMGQAAIAQFPANLESRIAQLESDNLQLRGQLNQLEARLSSLRAAPPLSPAPTVTSPTPNYTTIPTTDPKFQRLATLVVELKLQVQELEQRLVKLEQSRSPSPSQSPRR